MQETAALQALPAIESIEVVTGNIRQINGLQFLIAASDAIDAIEEKTAMTNDVVRRDATAG